MKQVTSRPYNEETDFLAVGEFLVDTFTRFGWMHNWGIERWEIQRYSVTNAAELAGDTVWQEHVRIWELDGRIVGVAHPEDGGDLWVEIDPDFRELENDMFAWGEAHRSPARRPGTPFSTYVAVGDTTREKVLAGRGWSRGEVGEHMRCRKAMSGLPPGPVADGYTVRSIDLSTKQDSEGRASVSRASFGNKRTGEMMKVLAGAPVYRPELDLAAIADDGTFAAYTTVWWEPVNRYIIFEPVCTHPEHRRLGLASAVIAEGMRRGQALGADTAYVGSGPGAPSNVLYESLGFTDVTDFIRWDAPTAAG